MLFPPVLDTGLMLLVVITGKSYEMPIQQKIHHKRKCENVQKRHADYVSVDVHLDLVELWSVGTHRQSHQLFPIQRMLLLSLS